MQFTLGEQPEWIGKEEVQAMPEDFIPKLLQESSTESLIQRGYAVVHLPSETTELYSQFHSGFEEFSHSDPANKQLFATLYSKEAKKHSPNQYHGYSMVAGLKDQYMMRCGGSGCSLGFPLTAPDMGLAGLALFEKLDTLCRENEVAVCKELGIDHEVVSKILDPVYVSGEKPERSDSMVCVSNYVPPGYISSSIMDNFHYFNSAFDGNSKEEVKTEQGIRKEERFHNNHASHSDSGLMTVVVTTDQPGLEVFDQKEKCWIALEAILHQYTKTVEPENPLAHRQYATLFWGDSYVYMKAGDKLHESMHRVAGSQKERYSVVFKQRTSPTATAPRYQEDYELGALQLKALDALKATQPKK